MGWRELGGGGGSRSAAAAHGAHAENAAILRPGVLRVSAEPHVPIRTRMCVCKAARVPPRSGACAEMQCCACERMRQHMRMRTGTRKCMRIGAKAHTNACKCGRARGNTCEQANVHANACVNVNTHVHTRACQCASALADMHTPTCRRQHATAHANRQTHMDACTRMCKRARPPASHAHACALAIHQSFTHFMTFISFRCYLIFGLIFGAAPPRPRPPPVKKLPREMGNGEEKLPKFHLFRGFAGFVQELRSQNLSFFTYIFIYLHL